MTQTGTWVSYGGAAEIVLAGGLMVTAATVFYAGLRRRQPARLPRPGRKVSILTLAAWPLAVAGHSGVRRGCTWRMPCESTLRWPRQRIRSRPSR